MHPVTPKYYGIIAFRNGKTLSPFGKTQCVSVLFGAVTLKLQLNRQPEAGLVTGWLLVSLFLLPASYSVRLGTRMCAAGFFASSLYLLLSD